MLFLGENCAFVVGTFWVSLRAASDSLAKLPARPLAAAQIHHKDIMMTCYS